MCRQPRTVCLQQKEPSFSKEWKNLRLNGTSQSCMGLVLFVPKQLLQLLSALYRTPLVEEFLIVLHSIHLSANTKQALSTKPHFITPAATALHTPSTIHNQLAQLQEGSAQQTPASPPRQHFRHAYSQAKRDSSSSSHTAPSSAAAPTPLSRSALQNAEQGAASSSSLKRQLPSHRGPPASQAEDQQSVASPNQTEYRNPVFGQVSQTKRASKPFVLFINIKGFRVCNIELLLLGVHYTAFCEVTCVPM